MKKIYIQPSIKAVKIQTAVMQSASLPQTLKNPYDVPDYYPEETFGDEEDI
ncbi:MAG: hypothetical protein IKP84_06630 [Prevotella sp.]|nr:hypothetical protein [Prevotella sp.]